MSRHDHTRRSALASFATGLLAAPGLGDTDSSTPTERTLSADQLLRQIDDNIPRYRPTSPAHRVIGPRGADIPAGLGGVFEPERRELIPPSADKVEAVENCYRVRERDTSALLSHAPFIPIRLLVHPVDPETGEPLRHQFYQHVAGVKADVSRGFTEQYRYPLDSTVVHQANGLKVVMTGPSRPEYPSESERALFKSIHLRNTTAGVVVVEADFRQFSPLGERITRLVADRVVRVCNQYRPAQIDCPNTPPSSRTHLRE